tara:strand:+ start:3666 stop:3800 length:135 start_codon:yes stop_codon:yes gene_type:complete
MRVKRHVMQYKKEVQGYASLFMMMNPADLFGPKTAKRIDEGGIP